MNQQPDDRLFDAQPDREESARWWNEMWSQSQAHTALDLDSIRNQWEIYEYVKFQFLRSLFPKEKGTLSLEIGCGSGGVSLFFAEQAGYQASLLDFAPSALNLARKNFAERKIRGEFIRGDAGRLPFPAGRFDVVMSYGLVEHFVDPQPFLNEMVRVLRPGGLFFADIVPRRFNVQWIANCSVNLAAVIIFGLLKESPRSMATRVRRLFVPDYFENTFSLREYRKFLSAAGLQDVVITGNNPFPRLYLPGALDRIFIRALKNMIPLWRKFDASSGWFKDVVWSRAWWSYGTKPK